MTIRWEPGTLVETYPSLMFVLHQGMQQQHVHVAAGGGTREVRVLGSKCRDADGAAFEANDVAVQTIH